MMGYGVYGCTWQCDRGVSAKHHYRNGDGDELIKTFDPKVTENPPHFSCITNYFRSYDFNKIYYFVSGELWIQVKYNIIFILESYLKLFNCILFTKKCIDKYYSTLLFYIILISR